MATRQAADPPPPPLANQALALPGGPHPPMGTQGQLKAFLLHAMDWVSLFLDFFLFLFALLAIFIATDHVFLFDTPGLGIRYDDTRRSTWQEEAWLLPGEAPLTPSPPPPRPDLHSLPSPPFHWLLCHLPA